MNEARRLRRDEEYGVSADDILGGAKDLLPDNEGRSLVASLLGMTA